MSFDAHKNFAYSTVLTPPSPASSGTQVTVASGDGSKFPAAPFNLTLAHANVGRLSTKATLRLRPKRRLLGSPRRLTVRVRLTATDAAGNHTEKTRTIAVRRR